MKQLIKQIGKQMKQIFLIDFGLCRRFRNEETGIHHEDDLDYLRDQNNIFASINQIEGHTASRRDDIIQILQTLVFLLDWRRDWIINQPLYAGQQQRIKEFKINCRPEDMCKGDRTEMLSNLMIEAYSYSYKDEPRYDFLITELTRILNSKNILDDGIFSWNRRFFFVFRRILSENNQIGN